MINKRKKAVVLLSGGLDSATVMAEAKSLGYAVYALSILYGQRHLVELEFAKKQCEINGVTEHKVMQLDLRAFGGSALTADIDVPKPKEISQMGADIPITYVPARNTIFLSLAMGYAEVMGSFDIFVGVNALDYSGYPDCRPEYIQAFEKMGNLALAAVVKGEGVLKIHTPLLQLTKAQIIEKGIKLGVDYKNTISCYDPVQSLACGECDACVLRKKGFSEANVSDPTQYVAQ